MKSNRPPIENIIISEKKIARHSITCPNRNHKFFLAITKYGIHTRIHLQPLIIPTSNNIIMQNKNRTKIPIHISRYIIESQSVSPQTTNSTTQFQQI